MLREILSRLNKPELFFQPRRLVRRILNSPLSAKESTEVTARTSWGAELYVSPIDGIGRSILLYGVYDLVVTEVLWRLAEPGRLCIDVGANIGDTLILMAVRTPGGRILGFEPHPALFEKLSRQIQNWQKQQNNNSCHISVRREALGAADGTATLQEPANFASHLGGSQLIEQTSGKDFLSSHTVPVRRLDDVRSANEEIWILKIDVEGRELAVLQGAQNSLTRHLIRHIVYEDKPEYPTAVSEFLAKAGYTIWRLDKRFFGPALISPNESAKSERGWEPTNYLATVDSEFALERMRPRGWKCLKRSNRRR